MPEMLRIGGPSLSQTQRVAGIFKKNLSGEKHINSIISSGDLATTWDYAQKYSTSQEITTTTQLKSKSIQGSQIRIQKTFNKCLDAIERSIENKDDIIGKANAINEIRDSLEQLWQERINREDQFGDIINIIQGVLHREQAENITIKHLLVISKVLKNISNISKLTNSDQRDALKMMADVGVDIFKFLR